jgi:hypothetical protein
VSHSHGHGMAPHSPRPSHCMPLFSRHPIGSQFLPSSPYRTLPLVSFSHRHHRSHISLPSEPHPLLFPFPHSSSRRERTMAMLFPTSCPTSDSSVLLPFLVCGHLRPPGYKCHLACLSSIPPPNLKLLEAELRDLAIACRSKVTSLRG